MFYSKWHFKTKFFSNGNSVFTLAVILSLFGFTLSYSTTNVSPFSAVFDPCTGSDPGCLGGTVFEDMNCNGETNLEEFGVPNVGVHIYDCNDNLVDDVITDAEGAWEVCGLVDGDLYRVEFILPSTIDAWANPSSYGIDNGGDVQFVTSPNCTSFGIVNPSEYCEKDVFLTTPRYHQGSQGDTTEALVSFNNTWGLTGLPAAGANTFDAWNVPSGTTKVSKSLQLGTSYGVAWSKTRNKLFVSAYHRQFAGFGPLGPDGIYVVDLDPKTGEPIDTCHADKFIEIDDDLGLGMNPDSHGSDTLPHASIMIHDPSLADVGKNSLGDLEISEDEETLYTVNLSTREVIALSANSGLLVAQYSFPFISSTIPDPLAPGCPNPSLDFRPFALGVYQGKIYVGAISSAESTQDPNDLIAYVYTLDPNTSQYTLVLDYNLRSERNDWYPWENTWTDLRETIVAAPNGSPDANGHLGSFGNRAPQPMMMDIEFYKDAIILGFRDRTSDQLAPGIPDPLDNGHLFGYSAMGDIDCAGAVGDGTYQIEQADGPWASICGCRRVEYPQDLTFYSPSAGDNPNGEFYFGDGHGLFDDHTENAFGGLAQFGNCDLVYNGHNTPEMFRSGNANTQGIGWISQTTGAGTKAYLMFEGEFAKTTGLGDIEALCGLGPLEVGNYVFCDSIENGIQDPCERGLNGVQVTLYNEQGILVGRDTTENGSYYFNQFNTDTTGITLTSGMASPNSGAYTGLNYNQDYYIVYGEGQFSNGVLSLGNEAHFISSMSNAFGNSRDNVDSDVAPSSLTSGLQGIPDGLPFILFTTDNFGCANHAFDIGFTCEDVFDLALTKILNTTTTGPFMPGSAVSFDIRIYNQGTMTAYDVDVNDYFISSELNFVGLNVPTASEQGTPVVISSAGSSFTVDRIDPGESILVIIDFTIDNNFSGESIINNAEVVDASDSPGGSTATDEDSDLTIRNDGSINELVYDNDIEDDSTGGEDNPNDEDDYDPAEIKIQQCPDPNCLNVNVLIRPN